MHRELGSGLSESLYEAALCHELEIRSIRYQRLVPMPVVYKGVAIGATRLDLVVEEQVVVEIKACDGLSAVHNAQLVCYLRLMRLQIGLLINFNVAILKDGVKRVICSH